MTGVLITGGAGFIGSVLTPMLLDAGHHVTVLDTFVHGENSLASSCSNPNFSVVNGDARDPLVLKPLVDTHDVLIPLAALVGAPLCAKDPALAYELNYGAIDTLCNLARPEQWIIYPNTNSGYGTQTEPCAEDTPLNPISVYGQAKCAAEYRVLKCTNSVAFRLATVFGASPRMRTDLLVNDFVLRAVRDRAIVLFDENACRNFIHIRDVALAFMHVLNNWPTMRGNVYNLGDSRANMTKTQLCGAINEHIAFDWYSGSGNDPDRRDYLVSNERLEATGWSPRFSLDAGIKELCKLYQTLRINRYANA